jgi:mannonate dehydratase
MNKELQTDFSSNTGQDQPQLPTGIRMSRRSAFKLAGAAALASRLESVAAVPAANWPLLEGPDTPKICLALGDAGATPPAARSGETATSSQEAQPAAGRRGGGGGGGRGGNMSPAGYQRIKQLGVNYVMGAQTGGFPWQADPIRASIERAKEAGLNLYISMINPPATVIYGRPGRDEGIDQLIASVEAAGKAGLPIVEYNFYAHRSMEGYFEEVGRANSGYTGYDYEREVDVNGTKVKVKDLPPTDREGAHTLKEMWSNIEYMLKRLVPAAEKAGVRLALHPNDPPAPISRGSEQIMGTVAGWKHLIEIVDSPANGITFDCGVTREMGEDPIEVARYFASRKRINHMHFRNVRVIKPYERYTEVFVDEGMVDMFGVIKEIMRNKYNGTIYPEHPRALDYDLDRPRVSGYQGGGGYGGIIYNVAYTRAMIQAAMESL